MITKIKSVFKLIIYPWYCFKNKMPLLAFIVSRLITMITILFILGFAIFALMELAPGDIVDQLMTQQLMSTEQKAGQKDNSMSEEQISALRKDLGLDQPFYIQYFKWLSRVFKGDLGISLISRAPVAFLIKGRLINSLILIISSSSPFSL